VNRCVNVRFCQVACLLVQVKHGIVFLAGRTGKPPRKRNKKNNHQTVSNFHEMSSVIAASAFTCYQQKYNTTFNLISAGSLICIEGQTLFLCDTLILFECQNVKKLCSLRLSVYGPCICT
jgi:hypothetical protein